METSYRSPLLELPGAVAADAPDSGVAAHYGDPFREQRRLDRDGRGWVDLSHRGVICVAGPDRLSWLHSLTSQDLEHLPARTATAALVLDPHGHVEHAMYAIDDGTALWAHVEPGTAGQLVEFLDSMRFLLRVEVSDVSADYAVVRQFGDPIGSAGAVSGGGAQPLIRSGTPDCLGGTDIFLPRDQLRTYAERAGEPSGIWALEALRIAAHVPRLGAETDHRTIPNEVGWLESAVALEKGCYRGQETVARVHNLGRPPRRLTFLHLDGTAEHLPPHGASVTCAGKEVGFVTSSGRHYELGPVALALLRRNTPVDAELVADGVAATQEVVVSPDVGLHVRPNLGR